ncbi:hypothetical protein M011DRAFT_383179, partial [Sporormia fimetaria CBS 119925]
LSALLLASLASLSTAAEVQIEVTKEVSCTRKTRVGDKISVHYNGTHQTDGTSFDSSYRGGVPFTFDLGKGEVIKGWDQGLVDMCIGEKRKLVIPSELAYGRTGTADGAIKGVFTTELMAIEGVKEESKPVPPRPTIVEAEKEKATADAPHFATEPVAFPTPVPTAQGSPMENNDNECHLLGGYALLVQGALGILALMALVVKRWREHPRRPLKIWFFDVSKQVFGSALLHLANVLMSMLSSGDFDVATSTLPNSDEEQPNPCSFYLLNIFIDTTIGIPILVLLLKLLHRAFLLTPIARPPASIRSGNYGTPPRITWWLKQSLIYFLGLFGMKLCVFFIFQLLPWIAWVGDWALRWTEGNEAVQITFVMFVFPLVMNALQYWIIDGFIKDRENGERGEGYVGVQGEDEEGEEERGDEGWLERHRRRRREERESVEGDEEREPLREANPTVVP